MTHSRSNRWLLAAAALLLVPVSGAAQWSVDIPGVPRASLVRQGGVQGRFELEGSWLKPGGEAADSAVLAGRMGMGWSWRVASAFEVGFDFSLASAQRLSGIAAPDLEEGVDELQLTGGYGLRFGLKFRPISYVDLEGNGVEVALGVGYQPEIEPAIRYEAFGDSSVTGGLLGSSDEVEDAEGAEAVPVPKVHGSTLLMAAVSYRHPRILADLALVNESPAELANPFLNPHSGLALKAGAKFRVTHGLAVGASYWGGGAPPWRDRPDIALVPESDSQFGLLLSFGGVPEKSVDLMVSSPTGSFGKSVTVFLSAR